MVDMVDAGLDRTADYLAKITSEITSPSTKEGRHGSRAPFAILRDALATGPAEDCELWLTWEKVPTTSGKSPGHAGAAAARRWLESRGVHWIAVTRT
jgi:hypothetical protein